MSGSPFKLSHSSAGWEVYTPASNRIGHGYSSRANYGTFATKSEAQRVKRDLEIGWFGAKRKMKKRNVGRKPSKLQRLMASSKRAKEKRVASALKKYLQAQNPGAKFAGAKIRRNKTSITIIPVKMPRRAR